MSDDITQSVAWLTANDDRVRNAMYRAIWNDAIDAALKVLDTKTPPYYDKIKELKK